MKRLTCLVLLVGLLLAGACSKPEHSTAKGEGARSKPYVASLRREPFHRSTCKWAQRITTENLVGYDTREQAIEDGRRPCKVCQP